MFKNILSYFDSLGWKYHVPESTKTLALLGIEAVNSKYNCIADVDEDSYRFVFFSVCPIKIPPPKRREMAELLTRINYSLFLDNFDFDFEDGEIRFKTSILYESIELTPTIIGNIITSNLFAMDENIATITTFAFGGLSIEEALKKIK